MLPAALSSPSRVYQKELLLRAAWRHVKEEHMAFLSNDKETMARVLAEIGMNEERLKEAVAILREWLKQQPHLPSEFAEERMKYWIIQNRNSLERTKTCLDMYFSLKNILPELLTGRDTTGDWFQNVTSILYTIPLPTLTPEHNRVAIIKLAHQDYTKFNMLDVCRLGFVFQDVRLCEDCSLSTVYILDLANYNAGFLTKVSVPVAKKSVFGLKKCFVARTHSVHVVNAPQHVDILIRTAKAIVSPKIVERIYVHSNGLDTLYEHVPKKILPSDYGGEAESIENLQTSWKKHMESYGNWLLEQDKFKSDETKRIGKSINTGEMFGFEGSFRQLSLD